MKKTNSKATKKNTQSQDALKLGSLYLMCFVGFQIANFIDLSIKNSSIIDERELFSKAFSQLGAFLIAYFITLIYIKNRN